MIKEIYESEIEMKIATLSGELHRGIIHNWTTLEALECLEQIDNWVDYFDEILRTTKNLCFFRQRLEYEDKIYDIISEARRITTIRGLTEIFDQIAIARADESVTACLSKIGYKEMVRYRRLYETLSKEEATPFQSIIGYTCLTLQLEIEKTLKPYEVAETDEERERICRNTSLSKLTDLLDPLGKDSADRNNNAFKNKNYLTRLQGLTNQTIKQSKKDIDFLIAQEKEGTLGEALQNFSVNEIDTLETNSQYAVGQMTFLIFKSTTKTAKTILRTKIKELTKQLKLSTVNKK